MCIQSAKQDAIEVISRLPDTVGFDEIVYRLNVINKIQHGVQSIKEGEGISSHELLREIEQ